MVTWGDRLKVRSAGITFAADDEITQKGFIFFRIFKPEVPTSAFSAGQRCRAQHASDADKVTGFHSQAQALKALAVGFTGNFYVAKFVF